MAGLATRVPSHSKEAIQISGFTVRLEERPERPLYINYCVDGSDFHKKNDMGVDGSENQIGKEQKLRFKSFVRLQEGSTLIVQIREKRRFHRGTVLATKDIHFDDIWRHLESTAHAHSNSRFEVPSDLKNTVWLDLVIPSSLKASPGALVQTSPARDTSTTNAGQSTNALMTASSEIEAATEKLKEFKSVLDRLGRAKDPGETILKFGTIISELHPIAKIVVSCVNGIYDQLKAQDESHKQMLDLTRRMASLVEHVQPVKEIARMEKLKQTMDAFPDLMQKAASFIERWLDSWTAHYLFIASNKAGIEDLMKELNEFKEEFDRGLAVDARVAQAEYQDAAKDDAELKELRERLLGGIGPYVSRRVDECMKGTRASILSEVDAKINDLDGPNLIWIKGYPGVGKSALASSIMSSQGQRALYFAFDRARSAFTTSSILWRNMAYELAHRYRSARKCILECLRDEKFDINSPNVSSLFTSLIMEPLSALSISSDLPSGRPLVFIVDAIDECGGLKGPQSKDRKGLLQTLKSWLQIPRNFKLVLTSRPEEDINRILSPISTPIDIPSGSTADNDTQIADDVHRVLVNRLEEIAARFADTSAPLPPNWSDQVADELTHRAAGVFQWVTTLANLLEVASDPEEVFNQIRSHTPRPTDMGELYSLYSDVLRISFGGSRPEELEALKTVAGAMVFAKRPLEDGEMTELAGINRRKLESIRIGLRSVVDHGASILRFNHQSFVDFLLSPECPGIFAIIEHEQQCQLTELCLNTMSVRLRFNMCGLETSNLMNKDVPEARVKQGIPSLLSYSCCFWADHLDRSAVSERPMRAVQALAYDKLLFWIEAMSLLKEMNRVIPILRKVLDCSDSTTDGAFIVFIRDALRFIAAFSAPITQSAPHIYLSALPFAPEESLVAQHFLPKFPKTITFIQGKPTHWPLSIFVAEHHNQRITHVAFSPDQKSFVSGSFDGYICICDSEMGTLIAGPLRPCDEPVQCACFSPDGKSIVVGHGGTQGSLLVILDAETGQEILRFEGTRSVCSVAYYDGGPYIASLSHQVFGQEPVVVRLWDPQTGKSVYNSLEMPVCDAAAISPDGRLVGCAYRDGSFRIWKVADRTSFQYLSPNLKWPHKHHPDCRSLLAFSPDSRFMVNLSDDNISVWNSETGNVVEHRPWTPPRRHESQRFPVAFSPDHNLIIIILVSSAIAWNTSINNVVLKETGPELAYARIFLSPDSQRLLVGCNNGTVKLWDLTRTTQPAVQPATNVLRREELWSVFFSPSGETVVACSWGQISFWDAAAGEAASPSSMVTCFGAAAFSHDARYMASVSLECMVHIWDMETGQKVYQPLEADINETINHLFFQSGNDDCLVVSSRTQVQVYDFKKGQLISSITIPDVSDAFDGIHTISPDGLIAIIRCGDSYSQCLVQDMTTSGFLPISFADADAVDQILGCPVCYSPSGELLASYFGGTIKVWKAKTGDLLKVFPDGEQRGIVQLAFSQNEQYIASSGHDISIWDIQSGQRVAGPWFGHVGTVRRIAFSPDGKKLVSYALEETIRLWDISDLQTGKPQVSGGCFEDESEVVDGWAMGQGEERLFWVPVEHRHGLLRPRNIAVIGAAPIKLDLTRFKYGESWEECIDKDWRRRMEYGGRA